MNSAEKFVNLYELLGVQQDVQPKALKKHWHKLAIKCHPDKVGGDEKKQKAAATMFDKLRNAYEALADPAQREAHDKKLKVKMQKVMRMQKLDAGRAKLQKDLERREDEARKAWHTKQQKTRAEITEKQNEEFIRLFQKSNPCKPPPSSKQASAPQPDTPKEDAPEDNTVVAKWKREAAAGGRGPSDAFLRTHFAQYGVLRHVVLKKRKAFLVFANKADAEACVAGERSNVGMLHLTTSFAAKKRQKAFLQSLAKRPKPATPTQTPTQTRAQTDKQHNGNTTHTAEGGGDGRRGAKGVEKENSPLFGGGGGLFPAEKATAAKQTSTFAKAVLSEGAASHEDYELQVLMRMAQRKKK